MQLQSITLYPIKSLGSVSVNEAQIDAKGLRYDRRYMLVTPTTGGRPGTFITQRTQHYMALIDVAMDEAANELYVWHRHAPDDVLTLPLVPGDANLLGTLPVTIWASEDVPARLVSAEADAWFSRVLGNDCQLVYMPDATQRAVTSGRVKAAGDVDKVVSFADGLPILLATQSSLDELNRRAEQTLSMARFRPNLVAGGLCWPHDEDTWGAFQIGDALFYGVKPCIRCVLTTIDPATGERGTEPLKTLATYRRHNNAILFGENVMPARSSLGQTIRVGDAIAVQQRKTPWLPVGV
ncbi:MOSC domain-containing protein [Fibrella sp. WM1]|uniref:MOSC domain-containing protein n=1 Tax=Fibrella musci TaxID=3242485 RepID=UPI0035201620